MTGVAEPHSALLQRRGTKPNIMSEFATTARPPSVTSSNDLKNMGLKATTPRKRILELFEKNDNRHLSADDIYKMLIKEGTDTGLATVYRVLTQFEEAGLLLRHHFESG
jgi:Fe2+ or Zn2+ uptake regulation protein